jgi:hypothetical protein
MHNRVTQWRADGRAARVELSKIRARVVIPITTAFAGRQYQLRAITLHIGERMTAGHYKTARESRCRTGVRVQLIHSLSVLVVILQSLQRMD